MRVQVDVGIGDAVTPDPEWLDYPGMLELPQAHLRAYRPETSIAEKLHAMVVLGAANSRMRDFFDIYALSERESFDGALIARAVRATFDRRRTPIPDRLPLALTPEFAGMKDKQLQWQGFMRKNALTSAPAEFGETIERLATFLGPVINSARGDAPLEAAARAMGAGVLSTENANKRDSGLRQFKRYPAYKNSGVEWLGQSIGQ